MSTVVTARLELDLLKELDRLAQGIHRTRSWLINDAIENYVQNNSWQIGAIQKGLESAESGSVLPHDAVESWLETWGTPHEKAPPTCK
jgi:predicted transcriptional regulator